MRAEEALQEEMNQLVNSEFESDYLTSKVGEVFFVQERGMGDGA